MSESNTILHEHRRVYSAAARMLRIAACPPAAAAVAEASRRGRGDLPMEESAIPERAARRPAQ
ncbi:hypothetical protein ACFXKD_20665 [Nocardiopsis aegyptia]|uniref:hypothetical protein n=1 Tax=Nocardiopsis aegyptia TaxID=220378 RepID=UPI00366F55E7